MILLVPLTIFLVLSVMLIVLLAGTKPPTACDTVEAFCDAVLNVDEETQKSLVGSVEISSEIRDSIGTMVQAHREIAKSWNAEIIKKWDGSESSYELISVPILTSEQSVEFKCQFVVNQWTIVSIELCDSKSSSVQ